MNSSVKGPLGRGGATPQLEPRQARYLRAKGIPDTSPAEWGSMAWKDVVYGGRGQSAGGHMCDASQTSKTTHLTLVEDAATIPRNRTRYWLGRVPFIGGSFGRRDPGGAVCVPGVRREPSRVSQTWAAEGSREVFARYVTGPPAWQNEAGRMHDRTPVRDWVTAGVPGSGWYCYRPARS